MRRDILITLDDKRREQRYWFGVIWIAVAIGLFISALVAWR